MAIASFHLIDGGARHPASAVPRLALDRPALHRVEGLRWWRLLGTGRDGRLARSFDPTRRAVLAVWDAADALDDFLAEHPLARRWAAGPSTRHTRLHLIAGHGTWGGYDVVRGLERSADGDDAGGPGQVLVVTHATVRLRRWRAFSRSSRALERSLPDAPGLARVVGVGELPVLRLGTVSVWESDDAARAATERWRPHAAAVSAARRDDWFSESLFARFRFDVDPFAANDPPPG